MKGLPFSNLVIGSDSCGETQSQVAENQSVSIPQGREPRIPDVLPILPIRNTVLFPGTITPLTIGRESSKKLLEESLGQSKFIGVFTQKDPARENPAPEDLHRVGVVAIVLKLFRQTEEQILIVVQALERIAIKRVLLTHPFMKAEVEILKPLPYKKDDREFEATVNSLRSSAVKLVELTVEQPEPVKLTILNIEDPGNLADFLAGNLNIDIEKKQRLLEELDIQKRVQAVHREIVEQVEIAELQQKIQKDAASQLSQAQRQAYLREQLRAIQRELGEADEGVEQQIQELRKKLDEAQPPKEVREQAERELRRLGRLHPASPEYSVIVSYVETISELPWNKTTEDNLDLDRAQKILDRDHYDLEKIKRRLIEYLAVRKLNPAGHGPILCFVGPPGVGKTSLGQSIADALGRKFVRLSLGGVHDEAEIRGHRRTYIGSMPGRIIQEIRRAGSKNPVMMLDEIDKLGSDFRGDPTSALLEVLDPNQNHSFVDHYLDVPFDLSQVMFICTANFIGSVPAPLRDRMEVIELPGYTDKEKLQIAKRYLVKRQLKEHGLKEDQCKIETATIEMIIQDYTREAGVRELERKIASICRAVAAKVAKNEVSEMTVTPEIATQILGPPIYVRETKLTSGKPGVVTGLAWTPTGGEILHIEAIKYPGKGGILLTGQIGDVMKESAQAALSLVKSRCKELGINPDEFKDVDIHIHVPAGAVPKDGPSAGIAMFTAIASLFIGKEVKPDVAMTGEITLRGIVLPIGGLKEKTLAALRAGIKTVIYPKLNEKDLPDIPEEVKKRIKLIPVNTVDEVLEIAFNKSQVKE